MKTIKMFAVFFLIAIVSLFSQNKNAYKPIIVKEIFGEKPIINFNRDTNSKILLDSLVTVYIHSDSTIFFSWILNENGSNSFIYNEPNENYHRVQKGINIIVVNFKKFNPSKEFFYFDKLYIDKTTNIMVDKNQLNQKKILKLVDEKLAQIKFSHILLNFSQDNSIRLVKQDVNFPSSFEDFTINYNYIPEGDFKFGFRVLKKPDLEQNNYYYITGRIEDVDSDTIFTNNIENLMYANFSYFLQSSLIPTNPDLTLNFFPPGHFLIDDPILSLPLTVSIYQDTTYSSELKWANFYNRLDLGDYTFGNLMTLQLKIGGDRVYGRLFSDENIYIPISETTEAIFGLTPSFYNGKMKNNADTLKIIGKWGWYYFGNNNYNQLFLSQSNDAFMHYPVMLTIRNLTKDSIIVKKNLNLREYFGDINLGNGIPLDSLTFPVPSDYYETTITNDKNEIAGMPSVVTAKAVCDLRKEDKNPPGLNSFQIVGGNSLSHTLKKGDVNIIRFFPVDDEGISDMELYYKEEAESEWHGLDIEVMDEYYYKSMLPDLSMGTYSLILFLSDTSGNTLEMRQEPAFVYSSPDLVDETTELNPDKFDISEGYPNPFNLEINFSYNIPFNSTGRVTAEIYNILGEKVKTLLDEEAKPGIHKLKWNGRNEVNKIMPSGIYLLKFNSEEESVVKKLMLLK